MSAPSDKLSGQVPRSSPPRRDLGTSFEEVWDDVRAIARDGLLLAALEARRAGRAFVRMVAYGVMAGVLLVTAWLALIGAAVLAATNAGAALSVALAVAAFLNVAVALLLVARIRRWDAQLLFVATLRRLREEESEHDRS